MSIAEAELEALATKHEDDGGIAHLETPKGDLVFKKPRASDYERFQDKMQRSKGESAAMRELVLCSMIYPADKKAGAEILKHFPGAVPRIVQRLQEMAGAEMTLELKG